MIDFDKVEFEIDKTPAGDFLRARLRIHAMVKIEDNFDIGVLKTHLRQAIWHRIYDNPAPEPESFYSDYRKSKQ